MTQRGAPARTELTTAPGTRGGYRPIEDYGVVGDLHSVALISTGGSIDWCCLPHFDSPSVFAVILDEKKEGFFRIAPVHNARPKQLYLPETNILITGFLSPTFRAEIITLRESGAAERTLG